jgi:GNAT superfamily N-acetyltransferase
LNDLRLVPEPLDGDAGVVLVQALLDELMARYGAPDPDHPAADELLPPDGVFFVAYRGAQAVGCGGLRRHDEHVGEVKRMYVEPDERRHGVGRAILRAVESAARRIGYRELVLETGVLQPEAIALYESEGYVAVEPWGLYRESVTSRCFAKELAAPGYAVRDERRRGDAHE